MEKILVIDDHELVLGGTVESLRRQYPDTEILTAQTVQVAQELMARYQPNLVIMDLSLPEKPGMLAETDTGIQFLKNLMKNYPRLNIVVQSAHVKALIRLRLAIDAHEGGFTVADKSIPIKEMLTKVDWARQGLFCTPKELRTGLELKPEWLKVLSLAFQESLQDKAIAERMHVGDRTVRFYWSKIQDVLNVYPDANKNLRTQTGIRAREVGLIN